MKSICITLILFLIAVGTYAQQSSIIIDLGYRNDKSDNDHYANWGVGAQYKYSLPYNLRLTADAIAYVPEDNYLGLDVSLGIQYKFIVTNEIHLYPLLAALLSNHSFSAEPNRRNLSELGISLGFGGEYHISNKSFFNIDFRYNFIDKNKPAWYDNYGLVRVGYGIKF